MNALDEICFLEQKIHDLIRSSQEYEGRAVRARGDMKKLQANLEAATKDLTFHENNIRHVKLVSTDLVNLNEYSKTKRNFVNAQATCENARLGLLQAEGVIAKCQEEVDGNARRIAGVRAKLAEYGDVIAFPGNKES